MEEYSKILKEADKKIIEIVNKIASKKKPVILATGASTLKDVDRAVKNILSNKIRNKKINSFPTFSSSTLFCIHILHWF